MKKQQPSVCAGNCQFIVIVIIITCEKGFNFHTGLYDVVLCVLFSFRFLMLLLQLETEKNRLEMLLNNNLLKKLDRLQVDLQEMTGEDRKQKLEMLRLELESTNQRQGEVNKHFKGRWL